MNDGLEDRRAQDKQRGFETAMELAGSWGLWQKKMFLLISASQIFTAMNAVAAVFLTATPEHRCKVPEQSFFDDLFNASRVNESFFYPTDLECNIYDHDYTRLRNSSQFLNDIRSPDTNVSAIVNDFLNWKKTVECSEHIFQVDIFQSTIVSEWNLVCSRKWLKSTVQATFMAGLLAGSVGFGQLSDRIGRRRTILLCLSALLVTGISTAFVQSYAGVLVLRFLVATNCAGIMVTNFVLLMEIIKPKARTVCGMCNGMPFGLGIAFISMLAYFIRDWRYLQMAISTAPAILLFYFWILPESPRWLATKGKSKDALKLLKEIAESNGRTLPEDNQMMRLLEIDDMINLEPERIKCCLPAFFSDQWTLVGTPVMRRRCLVSFYLWFSSSLVYYGLIFYGSNIKADLFLTVGVSGLIELPSFLIVSLLQSRAGRRMTSSLLFFICSVFLFILIAIPEKDVYVLFALATAGKFFNTAVFQLCYLYTSELVPTGVRNVAVGTSSMFARVGGFISPYVVDLLGDVHYAAPSGVFGVLSLIASGLALLLPETLNEILPQTVEEVEAAKR